MQNISRLPPSNAIQDHPCHWPQMAFQFLQWTCGSHIIPNQNDPSPLHQWCSPQWHWCSRTHQHYEVSLESYWESHHLIWMQQNIKQQLKRVDIAPNSHCWLALIKAAVKCSGTLPPCTNGRPYTRLTKQSPTFALFLWKNFPKAPLANKWHNQLLMALLITLRLLTHLLLTPPIL